MIVPREASALESKLNEKDAEGFRYGPHYTEVVVLGGER